MNLQLFHYSVTNVSQTYGICKLEDLGSLTFLIEEYALKKAAYKDYVLFFPLDYISFQNWTSMATVLQQ